MHASSVPVATIVLRPIATMFGECTLQFLVLREGIIPMLGGVHQVIACYVSLGTPVPFWGLLLGMRFTALQGTTAQQGPTIQKIIRVQPALSRIPSV